MQARLLFGMTMALKFDVYLVDEALMGGAGDARFLARCDAVFKTRLKDTRLVIVSHQSEALLTYCDSGGVIHNGKLTYYDSIKDAVAHYNEIVADPSRPY
jgi:capsular polysaccharide transport system ATP-binding protein